MFCTNCGSKLGDTAKFCTSCGMQVKQQPTQQSAPDEVKFVENEPVVNVNKQPVEKQTELLPETNPVASEIEQAQVSLPNMVQPTQTNYEQNTQHEIEQQLVPEAITPKKRKKKALIIAGVSVVVILVGAGAGYFMYQNHIIKQADTVMAHFDDGEYDEAIDLYERYSGKKADFDSKVFEGLKERIEQIKENYYSEALDYDTALDQLHSLEDYGIKKLDKSVKDASRWIDRIKASRESYQEAKTLYEQGDYVTALEFYSLVLMEDDKYYKLAVNDIDQIEQEEAKRQEDELLNETREQALYDAEYYAYYYDYVEAINIIEQALTVIPDDAKLMEQLTYYQELHEKAIYVNSFTASKYENSYMEQDKEIMTVSIELPKLEGDNPVYESINSFLEGIKNDYIANADYMAEEAREIFFFSEEYFYPYSLDLTYGVTYNNYGVLSIVLDGYTFTGGAHGFPIKEVYTFDLASGQQLMLSDLIAADSYTFGNYVTAEFQRMFDEAPEEYWEDAPLTVESYAYNYESMNYYITEDSIYIFFYPYDLGSYARGFVEIEIPYAGNEWMFNHLQ